MDFKIICVVVLFIHLSGGGKCDTVPVTSISAKQVNAKEGPPEATISPSTDSDNVSRSTLSSPWWKTTPTNNKPLVKKDLLAKSNLPILRKGDPDPAHSQPKVATNQKSEPVQPTAKDAKSKNESKKSDGFFSFFGKPYQYHFNFGGPVGALMKKR